jgi:hypothetical protein
MNEEDTNRAISNDARSAAVVASLTIIGLFGVYWSIQIQDVMEMLELAYGTLTNQP